MSSKAHDLLDKPTKEFQAQLDEAIAFAKEAVDASPGTCRIDLTQEDDSAIVVTHSHEQDEPLVAAYGDDEFDGSPHYRPPVDPDYEPPEYEVAIAEDER